MCYVLINTKVHRSLKHKKHTPQKQEISHRNTSSLFLLCRLAKMAGWTKDSTSKSSGRNTSNI